MRRSGSSESRRLAEPILRLVLYDIWYSPLGPVLAGLAVVAAVVFLLTWKETKRSKGMQAIARRYGFAHWQEPSGCLTLGAIGWWGVSGDPLGLSEKLGDFFPFDRGYDRGFHNLVYGERAGRSWYLFEYRFDENETGSEKTRHFWLVAVEVPYELPTLVHSPSHIETGIPPGEHYHEGASEYLERIRQSTPRLYQMGGHHLVAVMPGRAEPDEVEKAMLELVAILAPASA